MAIIKQGGSSEGKILQTYIGQVHMEFHAGLVNLTISADHWKVAYIPRKKKESNFTLILPQKQNRFIQSPRDTEQQSGEAVNSKKTVCSFSDYL